jgi:predicted ATP-grasp superfamily ATP-dependent carboligase
MSSTEHHRDSILVTDASRGSSIATIRALGRSGYRVLAADHNANSLGFRSRYVSRSFVYPDPRHDSLGFRNTIEHIVESEIVDLVIPVTDLALQPLAAERARFAEKTQLAIPDNEALRVTTDKDLTVALADGLGVPVSPTRVVETLEEARATADEWGWPLVLKPGSSHKMTDEHGIESFEVTYAETPDDLQRKFQQLAGRCSLLVQRYCRGVGHGIELLMCEGRPLAAFAHRRRREIPLSGGASAYRESVALDPKLYAYSVRLLGALKWTGLAMVEFKVGEQTELMEVNGRVWGSLPLAVVSGMDFPTLLARLYLRGEASIEPQLAGAYKHGVRCRDLQRDLLWIASVIAQKQRYGFSPLPSRWRAISALLGIFNPRRKHDMLTWDDPAPGLLEIPRLVPRLLAKVVHAREAA